MTDPHSLQELALFPLGTVLFPGTLLPLRIFEPRYVDLIGRCMRENSGFGVVAIREGRETGSPALPYDTGTVASIVDFDQGADGLLNIVIRGNARFRVDSTAVKPNNLLVANVATLGDLEHVAIPEEFAPLQHLLAEILRNADARALGDPDLPRDGATLGYRLAQYLPLDLAVKVELLEYTDPHALLRRLTAEVRSLKISLASD